LRFDCGATKITFHGCDGAARLVNTAAVWQKNCHVMSVVVVN